MNKRRLYTKDYILSIFITLLFPLLVPGTMIHNGNNFTYIFGFPCNYISINQPNINKWLVFNINNINSFKINFFSLFINTVIFYILIKICKKFYFLFLKKFT